MNKFLSLLGLARKAGKLSIGTDASIESLRANKSKLIIFTSDISLKSFDKIKNIAVDCNVDKLQIRESMDDLSYILGKRVGLISVNDKGFAKKLIQLNTINNEEECAYDDKI